MARKKREQESAGGDWIVTYSDMVTLLLCFFAVLMGSSESSAASAEVQAMISSMNNIGMGALTGGNTLSAGKSADLGNMIMNLPSMDAGRSMSTALRKAISILNPQRYTNRLSVTSDERGIVISLASDAFFDVASAAINIEETRDILLRVAELLASDELKDRKFRIEGHTDSEDTDPNGPWQDNWELSTARSISVLRYLTGLGLDENQFQVAGYAGTVPVASDATPEGRAFNRRVDIIILDEGHL
ncbi:MAG: flagellar motor protein MotB [Treponema sp.]|jgi:chemotaxis protein MotB|nr:flagellar motor protein MotB [Treponema sp.]